MVDLSRAKTILIFCFLSLNLFLAVQLWYSPRSLEAEAGLTAAEAGQAREALAAAGYELTTALPRQAPRLALLHVMREPLDDSVWPQRVLGSAETKKTVAAGKTSFHRGEERLEVMPDRLVFYTPGSGPEAPRKSDEGRRQTVESFLRERGFWQEGLKFDRSFPGAPGTNYYRYVQTFQGLPLFSGGVEVSVTDGAVREVTFYRVQPVAFGGREIQVISAAEALAAFVRTRPALPDRRIVNIALGYFSQDYDARRWEIAPAWRIVIADGRSFYVNAFTGEKALTDQ